MADEDWVVLVDRQEKAMKAKLSLKENADRDAPTSASVPPVSYAPPVTSASSVRPSAAAPSPSTPSAPPVQSTTPKSTSDEAGTAEQDDEPVTNAADKSLLHKLLRSRLVTSKNEIEILRRNKDSPLHSVKSFEDLKLKPELLRGVYGMGFNAPSYIQETALPALLAHPPSNMIAQSQSGTGKTAAFVLTMLSRVDLTKPWPQCICLAPTYELALQIGEVTKQMAKYMSGVEIKYAIRGEHVERNVLLNSHIVIGTPGTMVDWSHRYKCIDLTKVNVFVLDEADVMIDTQGHKDQSVRIRQKLRDDCQMLLFSATYNDEVMEFAKRIIPDPFVIGLPREQESLDNIGQYYIECRDNDEKFQALCNIYGTISIAQCMIFSATKRIAAWLAEKMTQEGHAVALLTGELVIEQRAAIIKRFREGKEKVLISTNVTARGIDVEQVTVVINFDLPTEVATRKVDCETYLHRIGRTGRFGKRGIAINLIEGPRALAMLKDIEKHFGRKIEKLDAEDMDAIEKIAK